ncbi:MAG: GGDEF domain-containing protein [Spirochaetia bacterium]|nr:GGDEF domain-containing protein [Spirochaetia bacterium]
MIRLSSEDKIALQQELNRININRAKITALILLALEFLMIVVAFFRGIPSEKPESYYMTMYLVFIAAMFAYSAVFIVLSRKVETHGRHILAAGISFSILVLAWCGGISLLDQYSSGQIIVYTAASICIAAAPLFNLRTSLLVFLPVHIIFLMLLPHFQPDRDIVFANVINSTTFLCIALGISYMRFNKQVEDYVKEKIIREKTQALEEANQKLDVFAHIDALTGIANRLYFEEELQSWVEQAQRNELHRECSIILMDIDYFKEFNDTYGHIRGDLCLKQIAEALSSAAASYDGLVCRIGGDEFALLLREKDEHSAQGLSCLVQQRVEQAAIEHENSRGKKLVTVSCGVGSGNIESWDTVTKVMELADKDLYREKALRKQGDL